MPSECAALPAIIRNKNVAIAVQFFIALSSSAEICHPAQLVQENKMSERDRLHSDRHASKVLITVLVESRILESCKLSQYWQAPDRSPICSSCASVPGIAEKRS
jgi:hypothetical protein